jgi:hypothetical protein
MTKDITAVVLVALVSILTITGAVAGFYGAFMARQAVVETQLIHIKQELVIISSTISDREDRVQDLTKRVARLETRMDYDARFR